MNDKNKKIFDFTASKNKDGIELLLKAGNTGLKSPGSVTVRLVNVNGSGKGCTASGKDTLVKLSAGTGVTVKM